MDKIYTKVHQIASLLYVKFLGGCVSELPYNLAS